MSHKRIHCVESSYMWIRRVVSFMLDRPTHPDEFPLLSGKLDRLKVIVVDEMMSEVRIDNLEFLSITTPFR